MEPYLKTENARAFSKTSKQFQAIELMKNHVEVLLEGG